MLTRRRVLDSLTLLGLAAAIAALVLYPAEAVQAGREGLTLCFNVMIPSLFPFFVLSSMTIELGLAEKLGRLLSPVMRPLFNVGGGCAPALMLGFVGGYPVGARTAITIYENGGCSKAEAERLLSFCNNSGPAFIFGVVGAGIFSSSFVGLLLYLAHTAASLLVGLVFRGWKRGEAEERAPARPAAARGGLAAAFTGAVKSSFSSVLSICAFVVFFTVVIRLLFLSGAIPAAARFGAVLLSPLGLDAGWIERLLTGAIELSSGVWTLREAELTRGMAMAAFMLGWAGLSVHCQVLSFIGESGLSVGTYLLGKFLHGVISAVLTLLLSWLFLRDAAVSAYLAEQVTALSSVGFSSALAISGVCAGALFALLALPAIVFSRGTGKRRRNGL